MKMRSDKRELDKIYKRRDRYEIPEWQREEVWDVARKQALIDSILRGWRLPKFYFVASGSNPTTYEVVDGQQRLSAIFEFLSDELELSEQTSSLFGGKTYKDLPTDVSDAVDDFEIDFDEITDASDGDLMEFFQRLQSGLQLNSSEKLNAVPSKLKSFCRNLTKHEFFVSRVGFTNKRYAHFDVASKAAVIEIEGLGVGLRYDDVKSVFESQNNFSDSSQVATRIKAALDFLTKALPSGTNVLRSRSITQSLITMACQLVKSSDLSGREKTFGDFIKTFIIGLANEVEKGQSATDADFIAFQKSINANVKTGPFTRNQILFRKLFQFAPDFMDVVSEDALSSADYAPQIDVTGLEVCNLIGKINVTYSAMHGKDLFKPTNKTVSAQSAMRKKITSYQEYKNFVENMYFLFWEGPGQKIDPKPDSFRNINILRTEEEHDVDHGDATSVKKKKTKHAEVFKSYSGVISPSVANPTRFPLVQLNILKSVKDDLETLLKSLVTETAPQS